ncbi:MAG: tRNA preQ1(34) S-adenosylmethionine ribosyltransferase-isomerase QueA [Phycisphaerales bacterium]|nr:tRNA preQ1(34) S-adenosylmethionine ribosyltransferase-isomerase QueA [Phycisphaerales bacterium]
MRTDELDFELPSELIATRPAEPRDSSRLLVVQRSDPGRLEHRVFREIPGLLSPKDLLVFNRSRVVPARLVGEREDTGSRFEGLYLHDAPGDSTTSGIEWIAMVKAKRAQPGKRYVLLDAAGERSTTVVELIGRDDAEGPGAWRVRVETDAGSGLGALQAVGRTPLPPYILAQRKARDEDPGDAYDRDHYQTTFASVTEAGSVAAPTAGLHFTPGVIGELHGRGVETSEVTLHVGAGTFKPVETDTLEDHPMHHEWCALGDAAGHFPPMPGRRVIAVGSTSARTIESYAQLHAADPAGDLPERYSTDILIAPGYRWQWVSGMVTNFHLPRSTLLAMIAGLLEIPGEVDGLERVHAIYREAIEERYRFFSYGDAMLILP